MSTQQKSRRARAEHLVHVGGEGEALAVALEQLLDAGLVHRHLAGVEGGDLRLVDVHGDDVAAELGEAGGRDQADPADADHSYRIVRIAHRGLRRSGVRGAGSVPARYEPTSRRFWAIAIICGSVRSLSSVFVTQYIVLSRSKASIRSWPPSR